MASETIDPEEFRSTQRAAWNSVAEGWVRWWSVLERAAQPLNERLVELAGVGEGQRVLDVATGIGEPALTAARKVGSEGRLVATDLAPEMLLRAGERARAEGLANLDFMEMDAEQLDFPEASFDAALSRWGLMLMRDPSLVLEGVLRVLKPGARLAVAVWSLPEDVPFIAVPRQVLVRVLGLPEPPADAPGPMRLGRAGQLAELFTQAGFEEVTEESFEVVLRFASCEEHWESLLDMSSSTRKLLAEQSAERREAVRVALREAIRPFEEAAGGLCMENRVRLVVGRR